MRTNLVIFEMQDKTDRHASRDLVNYLLHIVIIQLLNESRIFKQRSNL